MAQNRTKGKFSPEFIQKLKESVNLIEVVGEHVVLKQSGSNYSGLCPFHSERSPSFSVSEQKQVYHCYGCKEGGDLLSFVMKIHGISFAETIEELAERAKVPLPRDWAGSGSENEDPVVAARRAAAREKTATAYKLNRFVAAFYHQGLPQHPHIHQYFSSRGVGPDLIRNFYLGAAPPSWDALASHLIAKKAPADLAVELGLIRPSRKQSQEGAPLGCGYFDTFRNRAIFPILDLRGKVAGFGGRILPMPEGVPDVGSEGPKYMNSSESLLFHKSKLAFGLYQAQKHIREKDEVILVEGYFDVLALHAAGFENVVATCGTSLTPEHLTIFKRFCSRITLLFDGDRAGVTATVRAMETGLDHGLILFGAPMPEGLDPDEILFDQETGAPTSGGKEKMHAILESRKPLLDARIGELMASGAQGPEAQTQALKQIGSWLARYKDPVGREVRLQMLQKDHGVSTDLLRQVMGQAGGNAGASVRRVSSVRPPGPGGVGGPSGAARAAPPVHAAPPGIGAARKPPQRGRGAQSNSLTRGDQVLLSAIGQGGDFVQILLDAGDSLPPDLTISSLFDYPPARDFLDKLLKVPGGLQYFRSVSGSLIEADLDAQVLSTLTEALVSEQTSLQKEDVRLAAGRGVARAWARFSQQIKAAIAEAEAKKDAGLHTQLMKDYLDVQRKMKEFNSFYDEA